MLNYGNLNDVEFEYVCNDIMSRLLDTKLRRFGEGKDGGVDLTDDAYRKNIVVQIKHYTKTNNSGLIRSLKTELPKVKKINPNQYYVCCSKELSAQNISDIFNIFSDYMKSTENIITLTEIDDFLNDSKNSDILRKHYKLWIESTNILTEILNNDIFVDCEALLSNIHDEEKLFVKSAAFEKALECLSKNNALILLGNPGVGKTMTSKMLILYYAANGYRIRYTTDGTDIASLKKALSADKKTKEVILLDDCFGQAYFNMKDTQENELIALIKYVKMNPNKKLIMNSRVTIYREATERTPNLVTSLNNKECRVYTIDMTNMSPLEKAKILYNHLYFKQIPNEFFEQIKANKNYWKIIRHSNYNPRIIEYVCEPNRLFKIVPSEYMNFVLESLNNPEEVWKNEFERRLKDSDRIFVTTLYSLSNDVVTKEELKTCYNHRIQLTTGIDLSVNQFEQSFSRLSGSFIKSIDKNGVLMVAMSNPSINDFIRAHIKNNQPEQQSILNSSISIRQLKRLLDKNEFETKLIKILKDKAILNYYFENEKQKNDYITYCISKYKIFDEAYEGILHKYMQNISNVDIYESFPIRRITVLEKMLNEDFCKFYNLISVFKDFNLIETLINKLDIADAFDFVNDIDWLFECEDRVNYVDFIQNVLVNKMKEYCDLVYAYDYDNYFSINEIIDKCIDEEDSCIDTYEAIRIIEDIVEERVREQINDYNIFLPVDLKIKQSIIDKIEINITESDSLVQNYLNDDYYDEDRYEREISDVEVENIFNR
ncbi:restriction endonuclease [Eubacterium sp.]|uniref:nSTAND3 domain-containing NTPase n=1 Tax=Eubacterium sp. TaxID=142586 RepID=UPI0025B9EB95|nr:restriction endonuclease [Eubacterium sp.]